MTNPDWLKRGWVLYLMLVLGVWISSPWTSTKGKNYLHNEGRNPKGTSRCDVDGECNGIRSCDFLGLCEGEGPAAP